MIPDRINQLLPASLESERGLLCSFCLEPEMVGALMAEAKIGPAHFTTPQHAALCEKMQARWHDGQPITTRLMMVEMEDGHGGENTACEILTHLPTAACADEYVDAVVEKYQLREIITRTAAMHSAAWAPGAQSEPLLEAASDLGAIAAPKSRTPTFQELLRDKLDRMANGEPNADQLLTGIAVLDRKSPTRLGDMPLISGERKAGKSIFALSVATNVLMSGAAVLIFSLEDRADRVLDRLFAGASRIPLENHHVKKMSPAEKERAGRATDALMDRKMFIRDDVQDLAPMCAIIRQTKARHADLKLVVVDYAQLVRAKVARNATREQEVATVSRTLRLLGLELGVTIMVLCQLNKEGETRESKALEQDATAMWKILKVSKDEKRDDEDCEANRRLILIPFQRNGESEIAFPVTFFGHIARVENLADEP